jgi:oxygen-independent coproporphyrinogen-3 oxidase
MGVQSFQDTLLRFIGRRHNAQQAIEAVRKAQEAGFENISIDLMYALPGQTMAQWKADIETALGLGVQHISSYGLMYEEGTALTKMRDKGEIEAIDEETENAMYDYLCERLREAGFVHYEVSNFALPGYEAKHNSSYWNGTPYIGIGAGAHSYIGNVRSWNPNDLEAYITGMNQGTLVREQEVLSDKDLYNEQIMLGLRTYKGCKLSPSVDRRLTVGELSQNGLIRETEDGRIVATQKGIHILNRIIEDLMVE